MAKQLTRSAVRIYGALTALGNDSGNIIESLLPFFDPILWKYNHQKLLPDAIASDIRDTYKWNFNTDLVETFVPYLEQQGWIVADISGSQDTSYTIRMDDNSGTDETTESVETELRRIAVQFKQFSEALTPLTALPREVEEFEDMLVEWLLYVEAFSEQNLEFKTGVSTDALGTMRHVVEIPPTTSLRDEEQFLCARFVKGTIEANDGSAETLARIASIGLLTEVIQDFVKPVSAVEKTDLIVYLDAPVALEFLGVSGKSARDNIVPVIEELVRIGASVRIFGQSLDEIKHSLGAVLKNPRPTGPTAQALARGEAMREYVTAVSRDPAPFLRELGVQVAYRTLEQTPSEHKYFTEENCSELYGRTNYVENPRAREHDTTITALAIRQRRGRTSRDIFDAHTIVLTRNGILAQVVRRVCLDLGILSVDMVPPVVHRRVLATAMWLRTGMGAEDLNIPKRMLLASCERVLAIRPGVVEAVKRLTDALGDEDKTRQLDLLVSQDRSTQALMDKTLGASNVVTAENLPQLWQEMLHPHLEEERQKGQEAVTKAKEEGKTKLARANQQFDALKKSKDEEAERFVAARDKTYREDREAIAALCGDVARTLRRNRYVRIAAGVLLAIASVVVPVALRSSTIVMIVGMALGVILSYLTITGGRLIRTHVDQEQALATLRKNAERRALSKKLDQFQIGYDKAAFSVQEKPVPDLPKNRTDLFD